MLILIYATSVLGVTLYILCEVTYLTVNAQNIQSPCPEVFQYKSNRSGILYGLITVVPSNTNNIVLNVNIVIGEFSLNNTKNDIGKLDLYTNEQDAIKNIQNVRPLQYTLTFPKWMTTIPYKSKIRVNGNLVCSSGLPDFLQFTNITLVKTFTIQTYTYFVPGHPVTESYTTTIYRTPFYTTTYRPRTDTPTYKPITTYRTPDYTSTLPPAPVTSVINYPSSPYDQCGRLESATHLVKKGSEVTIEEYPWLVAIYRNGSNTFKYSCVGTLISQKHVLTAAHCTFGWRPEKFVMVMGRTDIENLYSPGVIKHVIRIENHENYLVNQPDADLSIIFLKEEVTFTRTIQAVCVWRSETSLRSIINRQGTVVGWGTTEENKPSENPRRVYLPVVSTSDCRESDPLFINYTSDRTFCAGARDDSGPCHGDSGSGFYLESNNSMFIRGIVPLSLSYDNTCDLKNYVIFTDIAKHYNWIRRKIS